MAILDKLYDAGTNLFNMGMQNLANNKLMAREDTAHQREVADLNQAGLNPLLATGGAAASPLTPAQSTGTENKNTRKEQELAQKQLEADIEKTKGEAELARSQAEEAKRHNLETESISRSNVNWKNQLIGALANRSMDPTTEIGKIENQVEKAMQDQKENGSSIADFVEDVANGNWKEVGEDLLNQNAVTRAATKGVKKAYDWAKKKIEERKAKKGKR